MWNKIQSLVDDTERFCSGEVSVLGLGTEVILWKEISESHRTETFCQMQIGVFGLHWIAFVQEKTGDWRTENDHDQKKSVWLLFTEWFWSKEEGVTLETIVKKEFRVLSSFTEWFWSKDEGDALKLWSKEFRVCFHWMKLVERRRCWCGHRKRKHPNDSTGEQSTDNFWNNKNEEKQVKPEAIASKRNETERNRQHNWRSAQRAKCEKTERRWRMEKELTTNDREDQQGKNNPENSPPQKKKKINWTRIIMKKKCCEKLLWKKKKKCFGLHVWNHLNLKKTTARTQLF